MAEESTSLYESFRQRLPEWIRDDTIFTNPKSYWLGLGMIGVLALLHSGFVPAPLLVIPTILMWFYVAIEVTGTIVIGLVVFMLCWMSDESAIKIKNIGSIAKAMQNRKVGFIIDVVVIVLALYVGMTAQGSIIFTCMLILAISKIVLRARTKQLVMAKLSFNPDPIDEV